MLKKTSALFCSSARPSLRSLSLPRCHGFASLAASRSALTERTFEEESLPDYEADQFFPVDIGQTLTDQYRVLGKLGFGANSTVWLCRDLQDDDFVTLKVKTKTSSPQNDRELAAYERLSAMDSEHPGQAHIRPLLASFDLQRENGLWHPVLVHPVVHTTMFDLQRYGGKARAFPEDIVRPTLRCILQALDFLHTEAGIAHCDLKLDNIMLGIEDPTVVPSFVASQQSDPVPRKTLTATDGTTRTIYGSRMFRNPAQRGDYGFPLLCDFGESRTFPFPFHEIQPGVYKAPEVLLQTEHLSAPVDIWNLGCMTWDMLHITHLFDGKDKEGLHNNRAHLCEMVGLLGPPPREFLQRTKHASRVFDNEGQWKSYPAVSLIPLEERLTQLRGRNKVELIDFLRSMLVWKPEERKSAGELLEHPWLKQE